MPDDTSLGRSITEGAALLDAQRDFGGNAGDELYTVAADAIASILCHVADVESTAAAATAYSRAWSSYEAEREDGHLS